MLVGGCIGNIGISGDVAMWWLTIIAGVVVVVL